MIGLLSDIFFSLICHRFIFPMISGFIRLLKRGFCQMYLFRDLRKAEENRTCNEKLLESYLGTTAQREVGEGGGMKTQHQGGARKNRHYTTRLLIL